MRQLLGTLLGWTAVAGTICGAAVYNPPALTGGFNGERCALTASDRAALATELAAQVRAGNQRSQKHLFFSARALGVALRLDPDNRAAVTTQSLLKKGQTAKMIKAQYTAPQLADLLLKRSKYLRKQGGKDNEALAAYLLSLANDIAPANEDVAYEAEMARNRGTAADWHPIVGDQKLPEPEPAPAVVAADSPAAPQPTPAPQPAAGVPASIGPQNPSYSQQVKPFVRNQASIKGLLVFSLPNGIMSGSTCDMIATVTPHHVPNELQLTFARPVGSQMAISRTEAMRAVEVRYPHWQGARQVTFSFGDKYTAKDGGSAGTAFSLLFLSLLDGIELDQDLAVTGDITVDWKVREVGGVPAKIRGAAADNCRYVAIPADNADVVGEMLLTGSTRILHEIQIFSIATLQDAVALARTDKPAGLQKAIDRFAQIQAHLDTHPGAYRENPRVLAALKEVVKLAPNHLSARSLVLKAYNRLPKSLSAATSLQETLIAAGPLLPFLQGQAHHDSQRLLEGPLNQARKQLASLQRVTDQRTTPLCRHLLAYADAVDVYQKLRESKPRSSSELAKRSYDKNLADASTRLRDAQVKVSDFLARLGNDRKLVEELLR